jgi:hypothetical protein
MNDDDLVGYDLTLYFSPHNYKLQIFSHNVGHITVTTNTKKGQGALYLKPESLFEAGKI